MQKSKGGVIKPEWRPKVAEFILKCSVAHYKENDAFLPNGICSGCKRKLNSKGTQEARPDPLNAPNYEDLIQEVKTDLDTRPDASDSCPCQICQVARKKGYDKKEVSKPGPGTKYRIDLKIRESSVPDENPNLGEGEDNVNELESSLHITEAESFNYPLCQTCLQELAPGKHKNCSKETRRKSIDKLLNKNDKSYVSAAHIREEFAKAEENKESSIKIAAGKGPQLELPTPKAIESKLTIPVKFFTEAERQLDLSKRGLLKLKKLAKETTEGKLPLKLDEEIHKIHHSMDHLFEVVEMTFDCHLEDDEAEVSEDEDVAAPEGTQLRRKKDSKKNLYPTSRWVVKVKDMEELTKFLKEERQISNDVEIKIGMDGGQGKIYSILWTEKAKREKITT